MDFAQGDKSGWVVWYIGGNKIGDNGLQIILSRIPNKAEMLAISTVSYLIKGKNGISPLGFKYLLDIEPSSIYNLKRLWLSKS